LPNGVVELYRYDSNNRLQQIEQKDRNNVVIAKYSYAYDANGNKTKVTELNGTVTAYAYDSLDRLIKETANYPTSGIHTIEYAYDDVGNRTILQDNLAGNTTYLYNDNDWLLSDTTSTGITTYVYDHNGNLTKKTSGANVTTYNWDTQNRLNGATIVTATGTQQATYRYDANGVRVASMIDGNETRYLVDDNRTYAQVLEEYKPDRTNLVRYVYDNGADLISQTRFGVESFYLKDGHSGVRILTNASGNVTDAYNYDSYGNLESQTGSSDNTYLYQGEQTDNLLSFQYLRARYYDPNTGRFISTDPVEGSLTSPVSLHRYLYGNDNPISYRDPSGEFALTGVLSDITLQDLINAIYVVGVPSVGVVLGKILTGARERLRSGGIQWDGTVVASSNIGIDVLPGLDISKLLQQHLLAYKENGL
jgi:RHS repeat-associated protein